MHQKFRIFKLARKDDSRMIFLIITFGDLSAEEWLLEMANIMSLKICNKEKRAEDFFEAGLHFLTDLEVQSVQANTC